jgi:hypothetical protein
MRLRTQVFPVIGVAHFKPVIMPQFGWIFAITLIWTNLCKNIYKKSTARHAINIYMKGCKQETWRTRNDPNRLVRPDAALKKTKALF